MQETLKNVSWIMPYNKIEDLKAYKKGWYQRKKAGLPTKITLTLLDDEQKRKRKLALKKKTREKKKRLLNEILEDKCFFCGYDQRLICHRKNGEPHIKLSELGLQLLKSELNTGGYARVCYKCHKAVHWCKDKLNMCWKDIEQRK